MAKIKSRNDQRKLRHLRLRQTISGTKKVPRLCVYRSNLHIYAQLIDDEKRVTLASASTLDKSLKLKITSNVLAAKAVGTKIAEKALEKKIKKVVFDRGGNLYHGRVKALAEAAREKGLEF